MPLETIARAVGASVTVDSAASTITIMRSRDQSVFVYNTITGQATVNDVPQPVMPSPVLINLSMPAEVFLPVEIMAVALRVSIEPRGGTISIYKDSGSRASPALVRPSGGWKDVGMDFLRYDLQEQTFAPRLLTASASASGNSAGSAAKVLNPTIYSRTALFGGGAHWGAYDIDSATTLVGGTPPLVRPGTVGASTNSSTTNPASTPKFGPLTYSSAFLNAVNVTTGTRIFGGTNFLKGFHDDRLTNGYPVLGISAIVPYKQRWTFSQFLGGGFTTAIPTGGGTTRFSYRRMLSISEASFSPNRHLTTSIAAIGFKDLDAIKFKTREDGIYAQSYTTWKSRLTNISALALVGASKTAPTLKGGSYAVDIRARRIINSYLTAFGAFDRYSQNFTNPQITSNYFNRQDLLVGVNTNFRNRIGYGASYSHNLTNLQFFKPDVSQSVNLTALFAPFKKGPQFNVTGLHTVQTKGAILSSDILSKAGLPTSKFALGSIGVSQAVLGAQLFANVVSISQTSETGKRNNVTTINLNAARDLPRLGQLTLSSVFSSQKLFQITALFTTNPLFRKTILTIGPGYSSNATSQRFTIIVGLSGRPPLAGNFTSNYANLLPQTTSRARLEKLIWLNKNHRNPSGLVGLPNQVPQGSVSGFILQSSDFPIERIKEVAKLSNVIVLLDDHVERPAVADKNGAFHFENITPGMHRISLDLSSVPASLAVTSPEYFYVRISPFKNTLVNFSLSKMGQIEGQLKAGTGMSQEELANTRVYLVGKKGLETVAELDGTFRITDIPAGNYTVQVDSSTLGPAVEVIPLEQKIVVSALETSKLEKFTVGRKVEVKQF